MTTHPQWTETFVERLISLLRVRIEKGCVMGYLCQLSSHFGCLWTDQKFREFIKERAKDWAAANGIKGLCFKQANVIFTYDFYTSDGSGVLLSSSLPFFASLRLQFLIWELDRLRGVVKVNDSDGVITMTCPDCYDTFYPCKTCSSTGSIEQIK